MILVTGGTGHVGDQVVRTLRKLGQEVRVIVRKGSEYYWLNDTGCKYFFGDLRDPESLRRAANDCSSLIVCSGVGVETSDNHHQNVTVDGHRDLFEAAKLKGIEKVVLISCLGTDREYPIPGFDARKQTEDLLIASGLDYTILRACVHERLFIEMAHRVKDRGSVPLLGPGTNQLTPLPARDLALMAVASLDLDDVHNRVVEVGGQEAMTAREAFELACKVVGVEPNARSLPGPLVRLSTHLGKPVRRFAHRFAQLATWFSEDFVVEPAATQALFQIPTTPLEQAMKATSEVYVALRDPEQREKRQVHPQFYATIYEPGEVAWEDLPDGPPPRRD